MENMCWKALLLAALVGSANAGNAADLTIGINLPQTGPGSSFGVPMMNAVSLMPLTIGGLKVNY
ncbi:MAG: branched-chain amino acid ABC transporter substrate-binding protein, partial [Xanthobacteraceae bacterium]